MLNNSVTLLQGLSGAVAVLRLLARATPFPASRALPLHRSGLAEGIQDLFRGSLI